MKGAATITMTIAGSRSPYTPRIAFRSCPRSDAPSRDASANRTCATVDGMTLRNPHIRNATANRPVSAAPRTTKTSSGTMLTGRMPMIVAR